MNNEKLNKVKNKAQFIRKQILETVINKGGHLATSFSCADILTTLYYSGIMEYNNKNEKWNKRDRLIISKGHAETIIYNILSDLDFFPKNWLLKHYRSGKYLMGGHIDSKIPGIEFSTGSLGHGLSLASGMALGMKKSKNRSNVFVLMSDGECTEGSVWEAAIFASKNKLNNIIAFIDNNQISATDFLKNFTDIGNLKEKFTAFGWNCFSINGHSIKKIYTTINKIKNLKNNKPNIVIANTIKGKGLNSIENDPARHTKGLSKMEINDAKKQFKI